MARNSVLFPDFEKVEFCDRLENLIRYPGNAGFYELMVAIAERRIHEGTFAVYGDTGLGKTAFLYAAAAKLNHHQHRFCAVVNSRERHYAGWLTRGGRNKIRDRLHSHCTSPKVLFVEVPFMDFCPRLWRDVLVNRHRKKQLTVLFDYEPCAETATRWQEKLGCQHPDVTPIFDIIECLDDEMKISPPSIDSLALAMHAYLSRHSPHKQCLPQPCELERAVIEYLDAIRSNDNHNRNFRDVRSLAFQATAHARFLKFSLDWELVWFEARIWRHRAEYH